MDIRSGFVVRSAAALLAFAFAPPADAGSPMLAELGRSIPGYRWTSQAGLAVADFDRDGREDIVVPGNAGTSLFQVLGFEGGELVVKQAVFTPDAQLARIIAVPIAGVPHLVTVSTEGVVRRFAGWPLVEAHVFDVAHHVGAAAIGDIDGNGALDLVLASNWWPSTGVYAYALATGELRWNLPANANDILIGQFDGDPAQEIVFAATPGQVIDGITLATDWSYPDGFGHYLARGRFQAGGGNQFVVGRDWGLLMAFQSAPWSPVWDLKFDDIDAVVTFDLDSDGFDDIIEGGGQSSDIHIIDGETHAIRLAIAHDGSGIGGLATWDPDGDGKADIAFAPEHASLNGATFTLSNSLNGLTLDTLRTTRTGPYRDLALARVGDGTRLVFPASVPGYFDGIWIETDALTGQVLWQSPAAEGMDDVFAVSPSGAVYSRDGSGGMLLVLAGEGVWEEQNRLIALDAQTHEVRWTLEAVNVEALRRQMRDMRALELPSGPAIAACVGAYADTNVLLVDAASGALLWVSSDIAANDDECSLMAGRFGDGNPLVVAVLPDALHAYDAVTHALAWTLQVPAAGASLLERGVSGREFVVFEGSTLRFHDAATRAELRMFDLGLPIQSVRQAGDIHGLLVAAGGHLLLVDGANGAIRQATDYLGSNLAVGNRIASADLGGGYLHIGVGSDGGVIRYQLYAGDGIFDDGFESSVD